jgi:hypothetical protein
MHLNLTMRKLTLSTVALFALLSVSPVLAQDAEKHEKRSEAQQQTRIMWADPGDVVSRNLLYGPGGQEHQPQGTMKFVEEDPAGHNPKFDVTDEAGTKWKVKMGPEAPAETVATRLLWAIGYHADEDYFVPVLKVSGMPAHLKRGQRYVTRDGDVNDVKNVRLKRHLKGEKKDAYWKWKQNPFTGTRELNGLRVMMALMNNWDLKDDNNAIYETDSAEIYGVSDVGSTFGSPGYSWSDSASKSNLKAYSHAKFITKKTSQYVDFNLVKRPPLLYFFDFPLMKANAHQRWIGQHIPREDAKWIGSLLARLTPQQIEAAFQAAGYPPEKIEGFSKTVEKRIAELNAL